MSVSSALLVIGGSWALWVLRVIGFRVLGFAGLRAFGNSASEPLNPKPSTLNPQPSTLNSQPETLNPKVQGSGLTASGTLNPQATGAEGRAECRRGSAATRGTGDSSALNAT